MSISDRDMERDVVRAELGPVSHYWKMMYDGAVAATMSKPRLFTTVKVHCFTITGQLRVVYPPLPVNDKYRL